MSKIIIGVCGLKASGKNEVFNALHARFKGVRHICMSDPIYEEVSELIGVSLPALYSEKEYYRPLLQWWGIHRRRQEPDYWVKLAMLKLKSMKHANVVVFTSVRMWEEVTAIRDVGGRIWRVVRPSVETNDSHITEKQQLQFREDVGLHNDTSLSAFHRKVVEAFLEEYPSARKLIK